MDIQVIINGIHIEWIEKAVRNYALAMIRRFAFKGRGTKDRRDPSLEPPKLPKPGDSDETRF